MKSWQKGFTLTELLVVVVIIGILAAVAVPKFNKVTDSYKTSEAEHMMETVRNEQEARAELEHGSYTTNGSELNSFPSPGSTFSSRHFIYTLGTEFISAQAVNQSLDYLLRMDYASGEICCHGECTELNKDYTACFVDPIAYVNDSGVTLNHGDTCTATTNNGCQNLSAYGSTCTANSQNGCANSVYENDSVCEGGKNGACANSTFTDSVCEGNAGGSCLGSTFVDSTCSGGVSGNSATTTTCGSGSTYINSTCINEETSKAGYVCGRSTYTDHSSCYSNKYGGCGKSTYSKYSSCYAINSTACDNSTFTEGSVCYANVFEGCKAGKYDSTSYCAGDFCPAGSPKQDGGKWRRCDAAHNDPADKISAKKSC